MELILSIGKITKADAATCYRGNVRFEHILNAFNQREYVKTLNLPFHPSVPTFKVGNTVFTCEERPLLIWAAKHPSRVNHYGMLVTFPNDLKGTQGIVCEKCIKKQIDSGKDITCLGPNQTVFRSNEFTTLPELMGEKSIIAYCRPCFETKMVEMHREGEDVKVDFGPRIKPNEMEKLHKVLIRSRLNSIDIDKMTKRDIIELFHSLTFKDYLHTDFLKEHRLEGKVDCLRKSRSMRELLKAYEDLVQVAM
jgi:hypothetical protein